MVEVVINEIRRNKGARHDLTFNHPYKPYNVQIQLMEAIHRTIDEGFKLGIFESPTGTGKTLSIICSTMSWLRDLKREKHALNESQDDDDDEPEWVKQAYRDKIIGRLVTEAKEYEQHLDQVKREEGKLISGKLADEQQHRHKKLKTSKPELPKDDLQNLAPDDYFSDNESSTGSNEKYAKLNNDVQQLLAQVEGKTDRADKSSKINQCPTKIYFASRTHSQLNQFSDQLRLTSFPSSLEGVIERTKYLPMGSRKQLCINENVTKLKDSQQINDTCMELQKGGKDKEKCCPYFPKPNDDLDASLITNFRDLSFSAIRDIEELHQIGKHYSICPYYSSRKSVDIAEIISLPYQLLLQKASREVLNLNLKESIVVIDEAHNLLDTITSLNSASVSYSELVSVRKALKLYTGKFSSRMNAGNRINLAKLTKMVTYIAKFIHQQNELKKASPGLEISPSDIFDGTTGDLLNIHSLEKYLTKSKIAYKIEGYMEKLRTDAETKLNNPTPRKKSSSTPLLFKIKSFLYCLSNPSKSGKLFFDKDSNNEVILKYLLLDPSEAFREVMEESKCVILAGGTMEPISDFTNFLAPYIPEEKIIHFNCDHIIPDRNLNVYPIANHGDQTFEFSFDKRNDTCMMDGLGRAIIKVLNTVPFGVVIFFPSYKYLDQTLDRWKSSQIFHDINKTKKVFTEPRDSNVDSTLDEYSDLILNQRKGAVLFAVVGGKMSEGINFSNDLARAVMMIGLPFPNFYSGELIAKRKYIEVKTVEAGGTRKQAKDNAKDFYENICMKAVNQSVGRAIRNINDYAVIYLVDARYGREHIQKKLSGWIRKRLLKPCLDLDHSNLKTGDFFKVSR